MVIMFDKIVIDFTEFCNLILLVSNEKLSRPMRVCVDQDRSSW